MSESSGQTPEMKDLRERVRAEMKRRGATTRQASLEAGIAMSTFQAFMAGTYSGDNDDKAEKLETWLATRTALDETRRFAPADRNFVETRTAAAIMEVLKQAQYLPDLVTVTGVPGVGKTVTVREYQRRNPNVWVLTAQPAMASTYTLLESLCEAAGVQEFNSSRRASALIRRFRGTGGLIVIDEAQFLTQPALEQLRQMHDLGQIGLALVGNFRVSARIDGGRTNDLAQLFSRVGCRLNRRKPLAEDVEAILDAASIEDADQRKLLRAIAAKPGALRGMDKTLRLAAMLAAGDEAPVGKQHLMEAWGRISDTGAEGEA